MFDKPLPRRLHAHTWLENDSPYDPSFTCFADPPAVVPRSICRGDVSSQRARVGGRMMAVTIVRPKVTPAATATLVPRTISATALAIDAAKVNSGMR